MPGSRFTSLLLTILLLAGLAGLPCELTASPGDPPAAPDSPDESPAWRQPFLDRWESEIWPLLLRGEKKGDSCVGCHAEGNRQTQLHYYPDARSSFAYLLGEGWLDADYPDSLLKRVSSRSRRKRMPPDDRPAWSADEIAVLKAFCDDLERARSVVTGSAGPRPDEVFPPELLAPFRGGVPSGLDNTFLSFYQLRGKFSVLFPGDDGRRGERDLFAENLALLGGADFVKSFNESTRPTANFFGALDVVARGFLEQAYAERSGPFAGLPGVSSEDLGSSPAPAVLESGVRAVFERILFRDPTEKEMERALELLRRTSSGEESSGSRERIIRLSLSVRDATTGLEVDVPVTLPLVPGSGGLVSQYVDQRVAPGGDGKDGFHPLEGSFPLEAGEAHEQVLLLHNERTHGPVSFTGLRLRSRDDGEPVEVIVPADDPRVELEGSWEATSHGGRSGWDDGDRGKGLSRIRVSLEVPRDGEYEIAMAWKPSAESAREVLVEVISSGPSRLALRRPPEPPAPGEAHFFLDQTDDTRAFTDLGPSFRFGPGDHVEIHDGGTRRKVTADAVRFTGVDGESSFLVDNHEAEGREDWKKYPSQRFNAYNKIGPDRYVTGGAERGKHRLRYLPSLRREKWKPENFYRVEMAFAAKRDHETRVPVTVRASASSPVPVVLAPRAIRAGARVRLDASSTFTVHGAPLEFRWRQTEGPRVRLEESREGSVVEFTAPGPDPVEIAWVALGRALIAHPDFLFTRPPSMAAMPDSPARRRLQLVKLTLDLLGRSPLPAEFERLERGAPFSEIIETLLHAGEFRDFYFHRIRLYLESQGTEVQDEPARLWTHVALRDRPVEEILTADYTVSPDGERRERPAHHGRTGVLTTAGFIAGKPGLPHYNYAAQVAEKFLGHVFEITPEIEAERAGSTALSTTAEGSTCFSCHRILTPLAHQRLRWDDEGRYREHDENGDPIDDSDRGLVKSYPFAGPGLEAFALQAVRKERFRRTLIQTHFIFLAGRELRIRQDERTLYREIWERLDSEGSTIRSILRAILNSPEYLEGRPRSLASTGRSS